MAFYFTLSSLPCFSNSTCSSPSLPHPSPSSFLVSTPFLSLLLVYVVHLPCCTEVEVKGQLPACRYTTTCVSALRFIFVFNIAWQLFPTGGSLTFLARTRVYGLPVHLCLSGWVDTSVSGLCLPLLPPLVYLPCYLSSSVPFLLGWPFFIRCPFPPLSIARANKAIKA